ncbi:MAG: Fe(2+) transporter permease subunit FeoB, partial [Gammaproteobacteria bacterium]|nr:Fe(2+) transporter permease subunit FeoB [Gammaproteobacteria bacterium]
LAELGIPMVLAVNMLDIVKKTGLEINLQQLAKLFSCPVVGIIANQKKGINELREQVVYAATQQKTAKINLVLPNSIKTSQQKLQAALMDFPRPKWLALRLLEEDAYAFETVSKDILTLAKQSIAALCQQLNEDPDILIADSRFGLASQITNQVTTLIAIPKRSFTQWLDRIVLNRALGIPIFLTIMYLMFVFAINIGGALQDFFDIGSNTLFVNGLAQLLTHWHWPAWLVALLAHGVGKGINTTITFIPIIGMMFLFLSFLEDSGYMARAAFVMDRFMRALGLPGKSFVPMIVGFGCNVPAVMGARTLASRRDRILTILMTPFMSCGARLAIFAVFAAAFFPHGGQNIIFLLYLTGIVVAVLTGLLLRKVVLPGKPAAFVMELPKYHMPQLSTLFRHAWRRLKHFLWRAGKVIVPVCVIIGTLNSISIHGHLLPSGSRHSALAKFGKTLTPVLAPMGVKEENWPATVGLMTGVLAKEVVVGTLNTLYSQAGQLNLVQNFSVVQGLRDAALSIPQNLAVIGNGFKNPFVASEAAHNMSSGAFGKMAHSFAGKAGAFAYLLFILLYFPCVSTMAAIRRELSRAWASFSVAWSTLVAYSSAVVSYQVLTFNLHPLSASLWVGGIFAAILAAIMGLKIYVKRKLVPRQNNLDLSAAQESVA